MVRAHLLASQTFRYTQTFPAFPDDISQTLAVSSSTGHVALFDLAAKCKLLHLVRAAHEGAVGGLQWLPGQPLMMTSGGDNSIKVRLDLIYSVDTY